MDRNVQRGKTRVHAVFVGGTVLCTALGVAAILIWPSGLHFAAIGRFFVGFVAGGLLMLILSPVVGFFEFRGYGRQIERTQRRDGS